jgi:hypothetical protein
MGLTEHKNTDEALYREAIIMLRHRNGTEYEDLVALDSYSGELLTKNDTASGMFTFRTGFSNQQEKLLKERKRLFELLHNHPNSSAPSTEDIKGLFKREYAHATTVVCHNGNVYRLVKLKPFDDIDNLIEDVYNSIESRYAGGESNFEYLASMQVIEYLQLKRCITFESR